MNGAVRGARADPLSRHGIVWRRAAFLAFACLALAALTTSDDLHAALIEVAAASRELILLHPLAGALIFVLIAAVSAMFAFVSVAIAMPIAVYVWGEPLSLFLLWIGWIVGGAIAYRIARHLGRAVVHWLTADRALRRIERRLRPDTPFRLILLLQLGLPAELSGYVLGLVKYPYLKFLCALAIAELPYAIAAVYLGAGFLSARGGVVLLIGLAIMMLSVGAFYLLRRHMRSGISG